MKMDDWAKPENHEVEQAKDAFAEAQKVQTLRIQIAKFAASAVEYGHVDRNWANDWLTRLGANPVGGQAQYQINIRIDGSYGATVLADSRADALEQFAKHVNAVVDSGEIRTNHHSGEGVYGVTLTGEEPVFFSGPEDPAAYDGPVLDTLANVKTGIRDMLKEGVTGYGWAYHFASDQADAMGLVPLPSLSHRSVSVPVSGVAQVSVLAFDGDNDEAVEQGVLAMLGRSKGNLVVTPEEIGMPVMQRRFKAEARGSETMGVALVDDDDDDHGAFD